MKHKFSAISMLMVFSFVLSSLVGCAKSPAQSPAGGAQKEKVTLQFYDWADEKDYMQKVVDEFNKENDHITVNLNLISSSDDEYYKKLLVMLSGGADLDLYAINGIDLLSLYMSKNALVDLTDRVNAAKLDMAAYGPSFQDTVTLEKGKYYALPYRSSAYALFYNKDVFDKAGVAYPKQMTWDEYGKLAVSLTKKDGDTVSQWGGYFPDWLTVQFSTLQKGSNILDDNLDATKEWLVSLNRFYNVDQSHMSYKEMQAGKVDWLKEFESGEVAMMVNGDWTINQLNADIAAGKCKINYAMAPVPLPDGVTTPITAGGVSTFIGIYSKSQKADAAFEFARYISGEKGETIISGSGMLPAFINDKTKDSFLNATGVKGSDYFFNVKTVSENQPVAQINEINQAFYEQRDLYLLGQQDIDTTINNYAKQRQTILAKK
jgi:multiple sugar transport system substrate-binding protein